MSTNAARKGETQMAAADTETNTTHTNTSKPELNSSETTPTDGDRSRSIDLRLTDYPMTIENADLLEGLFYKNELDYEAIAAFVPESVTVDEVRQRLRYEDILHPWDDAHVLEACYDGYDMSTTKIADTVCENEITSETVRARLHAFGILTEKSQKILEKMDPEDLGLSPAFETDDKYNRRGSTENGNGGANA